MIKLETVHSMTGQQLKDSINTTLDANPGFKLHSVVPVLGVTTCFYIVLEGKPIEPEHICKIGYEHPIYCVDCHKYISPSSVKHNKHHTVTLDTHD